MKAVPAQPSLSQINARVWLTELPLDLGWPATPDDLPDAELDRLAEMGLDWIWLLSVWRTGMAAQQVSLKIRPTGSAVAMATLSPIRFHQSGTASGAMV